MLGVPKARQELSKPRIGVPKPRLGVFKLRLGVPIPRHGFPKLRLRVRKPRPGRSFPVDSPNRSALLKASKKSCLKAPGLRPAANRWSV